MIGLFAATAAAERVAGEVAVGLGTDAVVVGRPLRPTLVRMWPELGTAVFFMGAGAAIRLVAPLIEGRYTDPGVVCVHDGYAVALTAAGNPVAYQIADVLPDCVAVSTSDFIGASPVDELVEALEAAVDGDLTACGAAVVSGDPVRLLNPLGLPLPDLPGNLQPDNYETEWTVVIDDRVPTVRPRGNVLRLIPRTLVVGVGASRGVPASAVTEALGLLESEHSLDPRAVRSFATVDAKAGEQGIQSALEDWSFWHSERDGCVPPLALRTAAELAAVAVPNPSVTVAEEVGTPSVAEAAALLTARELGGRAELAAPKTSIGNVTVAAARILPSAGPVGDDRFGDRA
ncbi:cobalamin biosynthesis protein [Actinocrispum wychmicini]|uniref:Cobalt-precorrin 5A hydrolase/precorrin-3B C17-methyltransferase n=1 Tax=Actinocrispum wychmicini TaxID=1213861 RepID=A0A4R2IPI6_9PSEU|nr:cobalamin biosynthesis protein [Actinocrispum wychmicini]TCO46522.1 cobalt-precorrin 5A hydrolase/precorrin-3B C17-methyltransferase [Actinocrispum wychmicini]